MSFIPWAVMAGSSLLADHLNPIPQPGEPGYTAVPQNHLRVMMENDSAFSSDRNYSHGTRFDYARSLHSGNAWGVSLVQNIYTPEEHTDGAVPGQHPYCGYMALGAGYMLRGEDFGAAFELQVGTTGNASCSRYTQNGLHEAFGLERWDGWHDQVPAEATVQLSMQQNFRLTCLEADCGNGWQTDGMLYTREEVGTAFIRGGVGLSFRYGVNLPNSMQSTGNNAATFGLGLLEKPQYKPQDISYFLVGSIYAMYVARDISIDGGVFHHFEQTCSRKPWQMEARLGVGVSYRGIDYFAGGVYCTDYYRGQTGNTLYGTFSGTWHW